MTRRACVLPVLMGSRTAFSISSMCASCPTTSRLKMEPRRATVTSQTVMCDVDRLQVAHDDHQLDRNRARRQQQELRHEHLVPKQRYRRGRGRRAGISHSLRAAKPSVAAVPDHSKPADSSGGKHPPWPGHRPPTRRPPARGGTVCYLVHQVPQARHEAAV